MRPVIAMLAVVVVSCVGLGCKSNQLAPDFSDTFWNPLGLEPLFPVTQEPVRIGIVTEGHAMWDVRAWWDLRDRTPWVDFRQSLGWYLNRPVQVSHLKLFQLVAQLESGRIQFALLNDKQFAELEADGKGTGVIARAKPFGDVGLIVASAKSDIKDMSGIAGCRFSFGPRGDPILHYGAAAALGEAGVSMDSIKREVVPLNALQYHLNSGESAKEIAFGSTPVGVILKSDFDALDETGARLFPVKLSKDQFRILGETPLVEFGPVVASGLTDAELVDSVRTFLSTAAEKRPSVTRSLGVAGFVGVDSTKDPS